MAGLEDAPARSAYLGRLIEITTQPLLEMLADNTPQRHLTATLGPPERDGMDPSKRDHLPMCGHQISVRLGVQDALQLWMGCPLIWWSA